MYGERLRPDGEIAGQGWHRDVSIEMMFKHDEADSFDTEKIAQQSAKPTLPILQGRTKMRLQNQFRQVLSGTCCKNSSGSRRR
jgi:hypothetical protein